MGRGGPDAVRGARHPGAGLGWGGAAAPGAGGTVPWSRGGGARQEAPVIVLTVRIAVKRYARTTSTPAMRD
ncbi:hypothetical protein GCM10023324_23120 [Streptomyces youssoufiensis]